MGRDREKTYEVPDSVHCCQVQETNMCLFVLFNLVTPPPMVNWLLLGDWEGEATHI